LKLKPFLRHWSTRQVQIPRHGCEEYPAFITASVRAGQIFIPLHYVITNKLTRAEFDPHSRQSRYKKLRGSTGGRQIINSNCACQLCVRRRNFHWLMKKKIKPEDSFSLHLRLQMLGKEKIAFGPGKMELMNLLAETGLIGEAARRMNIV
jgi:hypothetical protein